MSVFELFFIENVLRENVFSLFVYCMTLHDSVCIRKLTPVATVTDSHTILLILINRHRCRAMRATAMHRACYCTKLL